MDWILYIVAVLFLFLSAGCLVLTLVGMPGVWMMIGLAVLVEVSDGWYLSEGTQETFGWWLLGICVLLALVGEGLDLAAGALGAKKAGSTRRGMVGALIGGLGGAILGIGIPIPVVGSLIGAVIGTFAGAMIGEMTGQDATAAGSIKPATGATVGKILGILSKLPIALAVWIGLCVAAFWA